MDRDIFTIKVDKKEEDPVDNLNESKGLRLNGINYVLNDFGSRAINKACLDNFKKKIKTLIIGQNYLEIQQNINNLYTTYDKQKIEEELDELNLDKLDINLEVSITEIKKNIILPNNSFFNIIKKSIMSNQIAMGIYPQDQNRIYELIREIINNFSNYKNDNSKINELTSSVISLLEFCVKYHDSLIDEIIELTLSTCPLYIIYKLTCLNNNITDCFTYEEINNFKIEDVFIAILKKHPEITLNDLFNTKKKYIYVRNIILINSNSNLSYSYINEETLPSYLITTNLESRILRIISFLYASNINVITDLFFKSIDKYQFASSYFNFETFLSFYCAYCYDFFINNKGFTTSEILTLLCNKYPVFKQLFITQDKNNELTFNSKTLEMIALINEYICKMDFEGFEKILKCNGDHTKPVFSLSDKTKN